MIKKIPFYRQSTFANIRNLVAAFCMSIVIISCSVAPWKQGDTQASWQTFDHKFSELAAQNSFLAAEINAGECNVVHAIDAEQSLGVGSSFKLYILAELGQQIANQTILLKDESKAGREYLSWNSVLAIQQSFKSIPGGSLLFVPDNSAYTVRYYAEQMIQRSDNTATDHLLFLLGRKQVEKRMLLEKHHNPALNMPLLATREFAVLKFLYDERELANYLAQSTADKRTLLDEERRGYQQLEQYFAENGEQQAPVRIDTLEWFANRFDMCQVLMSLQQAAKQSNMHQLTEILSLEDPLGIDREQWTYVGFKGGSELGVLAGNWLLQRKDGRWFVVSFALNNAHGAIDVPSSISVLQSAVELLAQQNHSN